MRALPPLVSEWPCPLPCVAPWSPAAPVPPGRSCEDEDDWDEEEPEDEDEEDEDEEDEIGWGDEPSDEPGWSVVA